MINSLCFYYICLHLLIFHLSFSIGTHRFVNTKLPFPFFCSYIISRTSASLWKESIEV